MFLVALARALLWHGKIDYTNTYLLQIVARGKYTQLTNRQFILFFVISI